MDIMRDETDPEIAHQRSRRNRRRRTKLLIAMTILMAALVTPLVVGTMVAGNRSGYA